VEEVLGERVVGHELGDEQPLLAVAAVADQVGQAAVAQLPDTLGLLLQAKEDAKPSEQRISGEGATVEPRGCPALPCSALLRPTGGRGGEAYRELLGVGPRHLGELLDGDRAAAGLEAAPVHEIRRLVAALGHDVVRREAGRGGAQLRQRELPERRHLVGARAGCRRRLVLVLAQRVGGAVRGQRPRRRLLLRLRPRPERGAAAAHRRPPDGLRRGCVGVGVWGWPGWVLLAWRVGCRAAEERRGQRGRRGKVSAFRGGWVGWPWPCASTFVWVLFSVS
jgi:hypothetical protein